jgi:hypothetical protein
MAIAWFITTYKISPIKPMVRYCAMNDFSNLIIDQDGGAWADSEVLGAYAVVKVKASAATLTTIANATGFTRIPNNWIDLSTTLGSLTSTQRTTLLNLAQAMGYTLAEIQGALGSTLANWRTRTLGQVLRFVAQRRLQSRWDDVNKQIVLDGDYVTPTSIDDVDAQVQ